MLKNFLRISAFLLLSSSFLSCVDVEYDNDMGFSEKKCLKNPGKPCKCDQGFRLYDDK